MTPSGLVWLRRDLRLEANPAIHACLEMGLRPVLVYVLNDGTRKGGALNVALHYALKNLQAAAAALNWPLLIFRDSPLENLTRIIKTLNIQYGFWGKRYSKSEQTMDQTIKQSLELLPAVQIRESAGWLLYEPERIYRVFTPFYRFIRTKPSPPLPDYPLPQYQRLEFSIPALDPEDLKLLPEIPWHQGFSQRFAFDRPSVLTGFMDWIKSGGLLQYANQRDMLADTAGTSHLSCALRTGVVSVAEVFHMALQHPQSEPFIRQLIWRDFAWQLLLHFPYTRSEPLDSKFLQWQWDDDSEILRKWQKGKTGYPIVDAAMQELWQTGYMHNRARMLTASFLIKNLNQSWKLGEQWFFDTLIDADEANNILGWQWVAGCGADAAPYFRIFNPCLQGEKFDPDAKYIKTWLPALKHLPAAVLHRPEQHTIPDYPRPAVSLSATRTMALERYKLLKEAQHGIGTLDL